jgi:hypothetical protein
MKVSDWFKNRTRRIFNSFRGNNLPDFKTKWKEDGLFWAIPKPLRALLSLLLVLVILIAGVASFALGMAVAVLILSYWTPDFSFLGLPLGLSGECRVCVAILYLALVVIVEMALIMASWSRYMGDHWRQMERRENREKNISENGWLTRTLWIMINKELDFFGKFYYQVHIFVFVISFIAFFIKR